MLGTTATCSCGNGGDGGGSGEDMADGVGTLIVGTSRHMWSRHLAAAFTG